MRFPLSGAVLAGGKSERLGGKPKALLPVGPRGETLLARTISVLATVSEPVFVSVGDSLPLEPADFGRVFPRDRILLDRTPGAGPLGGLVPVLEASPHELCLVVACDMPFLATPVLGFLAERALESGAPAVVPRTARGPHPLHAVYTRSLLPLARDHLAGGRRALHELLNAVPTLFVDEAELRRYDPDLRSLENVNTPQDLERAFGAETASTALRALLERGRASEGSAP